MSATQFKAKCLGVLDQIGTDGGEVIITKRGKPVAKLLPVVASSKGRRGALKGKVWETGDIVNTDWSELFDVLKK